MLKKKLFSLVLAAAMLASQSAFSAFADGTLATDDLAHIAAYRAAGYEILSADKTKQASTSVTRESEEDIKFMNFLIDKLEEDDDVMDVYHNWENCD